MCCYSRTLSYKRNKMGQILKILSDCSLVQAVRMFKAKLDVSSFQIKLVWRSLKLNGESLLHFCAFV